MFWGKCTFNACFKICAEKNQNIISIIEFFTEYILSKYLDMLSSFS